MFISRSLCMTTFFYVLLLHRTSFVLTLVYCPREQSDQGLFGALISQCIFVCWRTFCINQHSHNGCYCCCSYTRNTGQAAAEGGRISGEGSYTAGSLRIPQPLDVCLNILVYGTRPQLGMCVFCHPHDPGRHCTPPVDVGASTGVLRLVTNRKTKSSRVLILGTIFQVTPCYEGCQPEPCRRFSGEVEADPRYYLFSSSKG